MRPSFQEVYMDLAKALSKRSTCERLNVGCVVTTADFTRVLGVGYNGGARGQLNGCDRSEPGNCGCLHAEDNALLKVSEGPDIPKVLFCTHLPCTYCSKRIVNKGGIVAVYYNDVYRSLDGLSILERGNIQTINLGRSKNEHTVG